MQSMRKILQKWIVTLHTNLDGNMRSSQSKYKLDYDRYICEIRSFTPASYVCLDNTSLRTVPHASAEATAKYM